MQYLFESEPGGRTQFPDDSQLGPERCAEVSFPGHGDIRLYFWQGDLRYPEDQPPDNLVGFKLAHGNETRIIASLVGYYTRLGLDPEEVKRVFVSAAEAVLAEDLPVSYNLDSLIDYLAEGKNIPRYDLPDEGLINLMPIVPRAPGIVEQKGGTGIYTREDPDNGLLLVFRSQPSNLEISFADGEPRINTAELCSRDIPDFAKLVCEVSMGDYRRDISTFILGQFIEPFAV